MLMIVFFFFFFCFVFLFFLFLQHHIKDNAKANIGCNREKRNVALLDGVRSTRGNNKLHTMFTLLYTGTTGMTGGC